MQLAPLRDYFERMKMRLDENAAVRFTARMGKSSSKKKSAAATLAPGDDESARGRLLGAATHLFCKNGINATGIDAIIHEAGTAKTTLYKLFGSKTSSCMPCWRAKASNGASGSSPRSRPAAATRR